MHSESIIFRYLHNSSEAKCTVLLQPISATVILILVPFDIYINSFSRPEWKYRIEDISQIPSGIYIAEFKFRLNLLYHISTANSTFFHHTANETKVIDISAIF